MNLPILPLPQLSQEELDDLPPYLKDQDSIEAEHIPLQLMLLTMELAQQHLIIRQLMKYLADAAGRSPIRGDNG